MGGSPDALLEGLPPRDAHDSHGLQLLEHVVKGFGVEGFYGLGFQTAAESL